MKHESQKKEKELAFKKYGGMPGFVKHEWWNFRYILPHLLGVQRWSKCKCEFCRKMRDERKRKVRYDKDYLNDL